MAVRGVRGAITVPHNTAEDILEGTTELLSQMVCANDIDPDDIAAAYFTTTDDLDAAFPAAAARRLGWRYVPLMDAREMSVPGSLAQCIRVMLLWNTEKKSQQVTHIYLRNAQSLRPDLANNSMHEEQEEK